MMRSDLRTALVQLAGRWDVNPDDFADTVLEKIAEWGTGYQQVELETWEPIRAGYIKVRQTQVGYPIRYWLPASSGHNVMYRTAAGALEQRDALPPADPWWPDDAA